jgi:hypothetical protein
MSDIGMTSGRDAGEDSEVRADAWEADGLARGSRVWARSAGHHYSLAARAAEGVSLESALVLSRRAESCYRRGLSHAHRQRQEQVSMRLESEIEAKVQRDAQWLASIVVDERGEEP